MDSRSSYRSGGREGERGWVRGVLCGMCGRVVGGSGGGSVRVCVGMDSRSSCRNGVVVVGGSWGGVREMGGRLGSHGIIIPHTYMIDP